ncbi:MAG: S9 family peptidase [Candidatus Aminicenantes bacterium]|nr:S9 family peptidase [Candidatus Aminicenantes bacterium]
MRFPSKVFCLIFPCLLLGLALLSPAAVQEKRPFEPEDMFKIKRISDPRISPDGNWAVFVLSEYGEDHRRDSGIWMVSWDGIKLQRITDIAGSQSSPSWSPSGEGLAFIFRKEKERTSQIFMILPETAELRQLTFEENSVRSLEWSPDGKKIAFLKRDVLNDKERELQKKGYDAVVVDEYRLHTRLWLLDLDSGKVRPLSREGQTVFDFRWAPDGKCLALRLSEIPTAEGNEYQSRLVLLDVETPEEKILCRKLNALAAPCFSPGGDLLAFIGPIGTFKERGIVKVQSVSGEKPYGLLEDYPGNVWDLVWHPREDKILAAVSEGPHNYLLKLSLEGKTDKLFEMDRSIIPYWGSHWSVNADGNRAVFLNETTGMPPEVWAADLKKRETRALTSFNRYFEDIQLGEVEELRWKNSEDGREVFGIVVKPPDFEEGRKVPLVVWFHGGPAYNWGLGVHVDNWARLFTSRGWMVFLPNFRGSSGSGMAWMTANVENWGRGPMTDVMSGVDALIDKGWADPERMCVGGGSYGGYLTSWVVTQTDRFKAAYVSAGVANIVTEYALTDEPSFLIGYFNQPPYENRDVYVRNSPVTYASNVKTPVLIVHGENDERVPLSQAYEFYMALKHYGAPVRMIVYPREYHGVREYAHQLDVWNRVMDWFETHMGK